MATGEMIRSRGRRSGFSASRAVATVVLVLFGFTLSGFLGAFAYFYPVFAAAAKQTGRSGDVPTIVPVATATATPTATPVGAPFTVLLLGSDDDEKFDPNHVLTQSMILVRVNPAARQVTMLSIPRDLWVPLSVGGSAKIDAAYAYGGPKAAIATVERNFHVHIDDYVWIGLKGLIRVIDLLGGVDVVTSNPVLDDYYPNDVTGNYPYDYQRIAVLPGAQHLDGTQALQYVRSRHSDLRGDFGRSFRQQQVLLALRAKAQYLGPADLPDLAAALSNEVKTSMGLDRLRQLLPVASRIKAEDVHQIVLVDGYGYTTHEQIGGQSALVPVWSRIQPLVREYFP